MGPLIVVGVEAELDPTAPLVDAGGAGLEVESDPTPSVRVEVVLLAPGLVSVEPPLE